MPTPQHHTTPLAPSTYGRAWRRRARRGLFPALLVALLLAACPLPLRAEDAGMRAEANAPASLDFAAPSVRIALLALLAGQAVAIVLLARALRRRKKQRIDAEQCQRYHALLLSMLDGWGLSDMNGRLIQWNPALRNMLGYTDEEMARLRLHDFCPAEDLDRERREVLPQLLEQDFSEVYEKRYVRKNGETFPVELHVHLTRDAEGKPSGMWSIVRDISARKRIEEEIRRTNAEMEDRIREATAALEASQARLTDVLESSDHSIWAAEPDGRVHYCNSLFRDYFREHYDLDVNTDSYPLDRLPPPKRDFWYDVIRRCMTGERSQAEYHLPDDRFLELTANPIRRRDEIIGVSFYGRDITERHRTRTRLRRTMAELEAMFANSMAAILMVDGERRVVRCNQRMADILGYDAPEALEGRSLRVVHLDEEHFERFGHEQYPPLRSADRLHVDFPLRHRDGRVVWCTLSGRAVDTELPADLNKGVIWVLDDITARRETEAAMKESEARFRSMVENLPVGTVIIDETRRTEYANPRFLEMLGYQEEELAQQDALRERLYPDPLYRQESHDLFESAIAQLRSGTPPPPVERRMTRRDGRTIDVEYRIIDMGRGRILNTLLDITDRRRAEQLREDIDRILRHDLKTPLAGLIGLSRYLLGEPLPEDQRELVEKIEQGGQHMLHMIDHSLRLTRIEQGKYIPRSVPLDLTALIREVADELLAQPHLADRRLDIQNGVTIRILGEEVLCRTLFGNLLQNALEATEPEGLVRITLDRDEDWGRTRIHNATPVPEPIREHFFDKYATWGKSSGTGLGTYSARLMTRIQGGRIHLRTGRDMGTELTVLLPLTPGPKPDPTPNPPSAPTSDPTAGQPA